MKKISASAVPYEQIFNNASLVVNETQTTDWVEVSSHLDTLVVISFDTNTVYELKVEWSFDGENVHYSEVPFTGTKPEVYTTLTTKGLFARISVKNTGASDHIVSGWVRRAK